MTRSLPANAIPLLIVGMLGLLLPGCPERAPSKGSDGDAKVSTTTKETGSKNTKKSPKPKDKSMKIAAKEVAKLTSDDGWGRQIAWGPNGYWATRDYGQVHIWKGDKLLGSASIDAHDLAFKDASTLLAAPAIIDVPSAKPRELADPTSKLDGSGPSKTAPRIRQTMRAAAFDAKGEHLVLGLQRQLPRGRPARPDPGQGARNAVWLVEAVSRDSVANLRSSDSEVRKVAAGDGVVVAADTEVFFYTGKKYRTEIARKVDDFAISALALSDVHGVVAAGTVKGKVALFGGRKYKLKATCKAEGGDVHGIDFHPSEKLMATGSADGKVRFWSLKGGKPLAEVALEEAVLDVAFSPKGDKLRASVDTTPGTIVTLSVSVN